MNAAEFCRLVGIIHNVNSSQDERRQAHQLLDQFRDADPNPSGVAFEILGSEQPEIVMKLAALNFVEFTIRYKWSQLNSAVHDEIKQKCLLLLGSAATSGQNSVLNTGITRCVVELAKRQWPAEWPEFHVEALGAAKQSPSCAHTVAHIFLRLCEDTCIFLSVEPIQRRKILHAAIVDNDETLWGIVNVILKGKLDGMQFGEDSVKAALSLCSILIQILPSDRLQIALNPPINILATLCTCLTSGWSQCDVKVATAQALGALADRKGVKQEEVRLGLSLFQDLPLKSILSAALEAASSCEQMSEISGDENGPYSLLQELCDMLNSMAARLSNAMMVLPLKDSERSAVSSVLPPFLDALGAFLAHPSIRLNVSAASAICNLSSEKNSKVLASIQNVWLTKVDQFARSVCKIMQSNTTEEIYPAMASGKVPNDDIRSIVKFASVDYDTKIELHADCLVTSGEWEGMSRLCKQCLQSISNRDDFVVAGQKMAPVSLLLEHWDNLSVLACAGLAQCQWKMLDRLLSVQSALFVVLPVFGDRVQPFLQHTFSVLCASGGSEQDLNLMKRHCCANLVYLVTSFTQVVLPHASFLLTSCSVADSHISISQRATLYQVPIPDPVKCPVKYQMTFDKVWKCPKVPMLLANYLPQFEDRKMCWTALLSGSVQYLKGIEMHLVSAENLIKFLGWADQAPSEQNSEGDVFLENRKLLRGHLSILCGLLNQFKPTEPQLDVPNILAILEPALNSIFGLLRCVHSMQSAYRVIHESYGGVRVFGITPTEIQTVSGWFDCFWLFLRKLFGSHFFHLVKLPLKRHLDW